MGAVAPEGERGNANGRVRGRRAAPGGPGAREGGRAQVDEDFVDLVPRAEPSVRPPLWVS
jgi:hypothetical protein